MGPRVGRRHDRLAGASLADHAAAPDGRPAAGIPPSRWTCSARLYPAMQAVRALATALRVAGSEDESNQPEGERADVALLLERARGYAARVGCLRAVA
jgi:hypothetical protein